MCRSGTFQVRDTTQNWRLYKYVSLRGRSIVEDLRRIVGPTLSLTHLFTRTTDIKSFFRKRFGGLCRFLSVQGRAETLEVQVFIQRARRGRRRSDTTSSRVSTTMGPGMGSLWEQTTLPKSRTD